MTNKAKSRPPVSLLNGYRAEDFFDEMVGPGDQMRPHYARFRELFRTLTLDEFDNKRQSVDMAFLRQGVTFNVYGDSAGAMCWSIRNSSRG